MILYKLVVGFNYNLDHLDFGCGNRGISLHVIIVGKKNLDLIKKRKIYGLVLFYF